MMRRFHRRVYVPPPTQDEIYQLIDSRFPEVSRNNIVWQEVVSAFGGMTSSEVMMVLSAARWKVGHRLVPETSTLAERCFIYADAIEKEIAHVTPYFCTFDCLEPKLYRFFDKQYGYPKTLRTTFDWEVKITSRRQKLQLEHPNEDVMRRRRQERRI